MPRRNGSYYGFTVTPTPSVASGIWRVREAEENLRVNRWPATPGVPGSPVGAAGDGQVSLAWSAPSLGSPPTDYQVQYSSNSGSTWTTFSEGTSTATSASVTGLTNGTAYIFRVRAVNALGEGPYGAASGTVTPTALNVTLLLHFNGTNGSTTFTDSSPNSISFTANNGAEISTAQSKFGGASGYFGPTSYIDGGSSAGVVDFDGGAGTVEAWVYFTGNVPGGSYGGVVGPSVLDPGSGLSFGFGGGGVMAATYIDAGAGSGESASLNSWHHIAYVIDNDGVTLRYYLDGVLGGTSTLGGAQDQAGVIVGNGLSDILNSFTGYIDELRVVKGTAVYTSNFTPPTAPF
jgi:hypothetical protein